jgi:hypothetical protein
VKFIKKNGRIIPIKEKKNLAIDALSGLVEGAVTSIIPNKTVKKVAFGTSLGLDILTAGMRVKESKSIKEFALKEGLGQAVGWGSYGLGWLGASYIKRKIGLRSKL